MNLPSDVQERTVQYPNEAEWLESRPATIGASELAGMTGNSHWADSTPFMAFLRKTGQEEEMDPHRRVNLNRGNRAETAILGEYGDNHPDLVVQPYNLMCVSHPAYPRIRCSPDGLLFKDGDLHAGVDAKFMEVYSRQFFGEPGTDDIPSDYIIQGLVSCECLEVPYWDFAVWFGRNSYEEYRVERNTGVIEPLIQQGLDWFHDHVQNKVPPEIDGSEAATRFLSNTFKRPEPVLVSPTSEALEWRDLLLSAEERKKAAEREIGVYKNKLRAKCGNAEGIEGVCSWKKNKDSEKTDYKAAFLEAADRFLPKEETEFITRQYTEAREGARVLRITRKK